MNVKLKNKMKIVQIAVIEILQLTMKMMMKKCYSSGGLGWTMGGRGRDCYSGSVQPITHKHFTLVGPEMGDKNLQHKMHTNKAIISGLRYNGNRHKNSCTSIKWDGCKARLKPCTLV